MHDFWEGLISFKVNTLIVGGLTISSALLGIGGTIATYHARDVEIAAEIAATRSGIQELRMRFDTVERTSYRVEEEQKVNSAMLRELLLRK